MRDDAVPNCKFCGSAAREYAFVYDCLRPIDGPPFKDSPNHYPECLKLQLAAKDAEIAALKIECEARKHYQDLDGQAMRIANNELAQRRLEIAALKEDGHG